MAATLVADCPRCGVAKTTFEVLSSFLMGNEDLGARGTLFDFEAFCVCRSCLKSTTFRLTRINNTSPPHAMNNDDVLLRHHFRMTGFVNISNFRSQDVPEHVPDSVANPFVEGARAYAIQCWNAAGCMFRTVIDITTIKVLGDKGINYKDQPEAKWLKPRLEWMFDSGYLPDDLKELSECIREDGNDAAHSASLTEADAQDLQEFSLHLLERIFAQPARIKESERRRRERRKEARE